MAQLTGIYRICIENTAELVYDLGTNSQFFPTALIISHILFHYFDYINYVQEVYAKNSVSLAP